jgi:hypothetical protein
MAALGDRGDRDLRRGRGDRGGDRLAPSGRRTASRRYAAPRVSSPPHNPCLTSAHAHERRLRRRRAVGTIHRHGTTRGCETAPAITDRYGEAPNPRHGQTPRSLVELGDLTPHHTHQQADDSAEHHNHQHADDSAGHNIPGDLYESPRDDIDRHLTDSSRDDIHRHLDRWLARLARDSGPVSRGDHRSRRFGIIYA